MVQNELEILNNKLSENLKYKNDIYSDINKFVLNFSKRIRSKLAILYLKANNKEVNNKIYNILIAGELIHNASLLHDDIIDNNNVRRGIPTIGAKYSSELSILAGDYLLSIAVKSLLPINNNVILNKFLECTQLMAQSEITQLLNRGNKPTEIEYNKISRGKTAKLFETVLECCALVENLDLNNAKILGKNFGILFQIKNDISENSRLNDSLNGVYTAIDIFGVEKTNSLIDNYKEEILSVISNYPNSKYAKGIEDIVNLL